MRKPLVVMAFAAAVVALLGLTFAPAAQKGGNDKKPPADSKKGHIGVIIQTARAAGLKDTKGIYIVGALPGLAASKAGLRSGDVIVKIDGKEAPASVKEAVAGITSLGPGKTVEIEYRRGGKTVKTTITLGKPISSEAMFKKMTQAAGKGESWAQDQLGNTYRAGKAVKQDYAKAVEWYAKAAKQEYGPAYVHLGEMYLSGRGVDKDEKKGVEFLHKGADKALPSAQFLLGLCSAKGLGVPMDLKEAAKWYQRGAEAGDARSQFSLGLCHFQGVGTKKDPKMAFRWFHEAAKQDSPAAQYNVGIMFERGIGVKMDAKQARRWYERAAKLGFERAKQKLKSLDP